MLRKTLLLLATLLAAVPAIGCGDAEREPPAAPRPAPPSRQIAMAGNLACAVGADGVARCWGSNVGGSAGMPPESEASDPHDVVGLPPVRSLALGGASCALSASGEVWCWGPNSCDLLGYPAAEVLDRGDAFRVPGASEAVDVAVAITKACVLREDGATRCWGDEGIDPGEDGLGRHAICETATLDVVPELQRARSLHRMYELMCAVDAEERLVCFGWSTVAPYDSQYVATPSPIFSFVAPRAVASSLSRRCVVTGDGDLACWGENPHGEVGDATTVNRTEPGVILSDVVDVSLGLTHACAVLGDGTVRCWGCRLESNGCPLDDYPVYDTTPTEVSGVSDVVQIAAGYDATCALRRDGEVLCWGKNDRGQLGDGTRVGHVEPAPIVWPASNE